MTSHTTLLLAHAGHPGPETHGDLTHFLIGAAIALPVLLAAGLWLRHRSHSAETAKQTQKQD